MPQMRKDSESIPTTQKQVLGVRQICVELGFAKGSHERPQSGFRETTKTWRRQYITRDGIPGKDLVEWKKLQVRRDLFSMAEKYLESGFGNRYWPPGGYSMPGPTLIYPTDKQRITELLQQLFWQQNSNELHNASYPHSSPTAHSRSGSLEEPPTSQAHSGQAPDICSTYPAQQYRSRRLTQPTHKLRDSVALPQSHTHPPGSGVSAEECHITSLAQNAVPDGCKKTTSSTGANNYISEVPCDNRETERLWKNPRIKIVKLKFYGSGFRDLVNRNVRLHSEVPYPPSRELPSSTESERDKLHDRDDDDTEYKPGSSFKRQRLSSQKSKMSVDKLRPGARRRPSPTYVRQSSSGERKGLSHATAAARTRSKLKHPHLIIVPGTNEEMVEICSSSRSNSMEIYEQEDTLRSSSEKQATKAHSNTHSNGSCIDERIDELPSPSLNHRIVETVNNGGSEPLPGISNPRQDGSDARQITPRHNEIEMTVVSQSRELLDPEPSWEPQDDHLSVSATINEQADTLDNQSPHRHFTSGHDTEPQSQTCSSLGSLGEDQKHTRTSRNSETTVEPQNINQHPASLELLPHEQQKSQHSRGFPDIESDLSKSTYGANQEVGTENYQPSTDQDALELAAKEEQRIFSKQRVVKRNGEATPQGRAYLPCETQIQASPSKQSADNPVTPSNQGSSGAESSQILPSMTSKGLIAPAQQQTSDLLKADLPESPSAEELCNKQPKQIHAPTQQSGGAVQSEEIADTIEAAHPSQSLNLDHVSRQPENAHAIRGGTPETSPKGPRYKLQQPLASKYRQLSSNAVSTSRAQQGQSLPSSIMNGEAQMKSQQHHSSSKSVIRVWYSVVVSKHPRHVVKSWPQGSIQNKSLSDVFDEVEVFISRKNVQRIDFRLTTPQEERIFPVSRDDEDQYQRMRRVFSEVLRMGIRKGNMEFEIWLEPDPEDQEAEADDEDTDIRPFFLE